MNAQRAIIGVSLKMYFDPARSVEWSRRVAELARTHPAITGGGVRLVVLPSMPVIRDVVEVFDDTLVAVGAQDLFWEDRGPYTGAISGSDLKQIGCEYVEIGHIERRRLFGEDDHMVNLKVKAALRNDLTPLLCIGEADQGPVADAAADCIAQLELALAGVEAPGAETKPVPLVIAYEPSWAIGVQQPASAEHVIGVTTILRTWLEARPSSQGASLIYGGSAGEGLLTALDGAGDGLFLGRFAHDALALKAILDEALQLR